MKHSHTLPWLLSLTLVIWWMALGGQDVYILPAALVVIHIGFLIYSGRFSEEVGALGHQYCRWITTSDGERWWKRIIIMHGLLFFITAVLKYYSFRLNTWDAGIYNNIFFNISQGRFYSSFHNTHNFADHFTPSISFISIFYALIPSIHWMMGFKVLAYVLCPFLLYQIAKNAYDYQSHAKIIGCTLGISWILFYDPAVRSLNYEFQSSCLAPPAILYAFLSLQKEKWLSFTIAMLFMLGLKEHLGSVWIGIGGYLVLATPRKKLGIALIGSGALALWLIIFQVMPYFRNGLPSLNMVIAPFALLPQKIMYSLKLLFPFMFLPLIFWRYGILAGPAIGINLVSGRASMVSSKYHYDDVTSVLLFLATLLAIQEVPWQSLWAQWRNRKSRQWGLLLWGILCLFLLPAGPIKPLFQAIPTNIHGAFRTEIRRFNTDSKAEPIAVQTALGPHFFREHIRDLVHHAGGSCAEQNSSSQIGIPVKYLIVAPGLNPYMIHDTQRCIETLEQSSNYRRLPQFHHLHVYENLDYEPKSSDLEPTT